MAMHQVDFRLARLGSMLFDFVVTDTARRLCENLPALGYSVSESEIRITGELNDEEYKKYEALMNGVDRLS